MASRATRQRIRGDRVARKCVTLKVGYPTREAALAACEGQMQLGRVAPGCHVMPYRCEECREYHTRNERIVPTAPEDLSKHDYRRRHP